MYGDDDFGYDSFERDDDYNVFEERQLDLDRQAGEFDDRDPEGPCCPNCGAELESDDWCDECEMYVADMDENIREGLAETEEGIFHGEIPEE